MYKARVVERRQVYKKEGRYKGRKEIRKDGRNVGWQEDGRQIRRKEGKRKKGR